MKLILCPVCMDIRALDTEMVYCKCKQAFGRYLDDINAEIGGSAIPLGFDNTSFTEAVRKDRGRPTGQIMGTRFVAFVIPLPCQTIRKI